MTPPSAIEQEHMTPPEDHPDAGILREFLVSNFAMEIYGEPTERSFILSLLLADLSSLTGIPLDRLLADLYQDVLARSAEARGQVVRPLYRVLATRLRERDQADDRGDEVLAEAIESVLTGLLRTYFGKATEGYVDVPAGVREAYLDFERSGADELVIEFEYRHPDGPVTSHILFVRPALADQFDLRIGGRNRNNIKQLLLGRFRSLLCEEVPFR